MLGIDMRDLYGMVVPQPLGIAESDADSAAGELRALARQWAGLNGLRVVGDVEIIRHRDVTELDWQLMDVDLYADWQPGAEVWGWKMQAEPDGKV